MSTSPRTSTPTEPATGSVIGRWLAAEESGPLARTVVVVLAAFCFFQVKAFEPRLLAPGLGLVLSVLCVTIIWKRWDKQHDARLGLWLLGVAVADGVLLTATRSLFVQSEPAVGVTLCVALAVAAGAAILADGRRARIAFAVLLATYAVITIGDLSLYDVTIDVQQLLEGGLDAALAGHSPYAITIPNLFSPEETSQFYGPGAVVDGRVIYGYPYLPAPLLLDIPAHILGDARWMHLASVLGAGAVAWRLSTDRIGRAASVFLVINPLTTTVLIAWWIEPVIVLFLALSVWGMRAGHRWTGVAVGLLFASKQYAISYVPSLWSVARSSGWRAVALAAAVGAVVVGAFAVMDPSAFVKSVVEFHLIQPFRRDSMSLLPGLEELFGTLPSWMLSVSPLLGLAVSAAVAWRTRPGATAFALGVGLSLMVTVLFSKQAHLNYFQVIGAALLLAVITWPRDNPIAETTSDAVVDEVA